MTNVFDINGSEFLLILVVAVLVIGPERLPKYAAQLGAWVRTMREFLRTAKERVDAELGEQAADVDWTALDPRRYDPRRIVREALTDVVDVDDPLGLKGTSPGGPTANGRAAANGSTAAANGTAANGTAAGGAAAGGTAQQHSSAPDPARAAADEPVFDPDAT